MTAAGDAALAREIAGAVADAHRREWAYVLAATVRVTRDLDQAEECVQDAYVRALTTWRESGVPANPGGWLATAARRRALDELRRASTLRRKLPLLVTDATRPSPEGTTPDEPGVAIPDDRLRLIFTCCHPALDEQARIALALRLLCGLTTAEVARGFLVAEPTMAARITRAKKKIAAAGIPYRVPAGKELAPRLDAVLGVVHLLFTTGHTVPEGTTLMRRDLVVRALDLARMLRALLPEDPEVAGLLALLLLTDARSAARLDAEGRLLLLAQQDRHRWDHAAIAEGDVLVREALARRTRRSPGRFALMAAIAAVHATAPSWSDTDWGEIVALYDLLATAWPSPVVALNRAVAVGFARGPAAGLRALEPLATEPRLAAYGYLAAARADLLAGLGRTVEARDAYDEALALTGNAVEREFLAGRRRALGG